MALPNNGSPISFSQINTELGRSANATLTIDTAENGGYGAINTCSPFRPSSSNPANVSEWFSYNHTAPCFNYYCAGYSDTSSAEACAGTPECIPVFSAHDYAIIRFNWTNAAGIDLDTVSGFINTGVSGVDDNTVGFGQGQNVVPDGATPISNTFVYFNGDNLQSGVEAVSVNFTRLLAVHPGISANPIRFRIAAWWFNTRLTGNVTLEFLAYSGGNPSVGTQFNIVPGAGSTLSSYVKLDVNVAATNAGGSASFATTQTLGYLNYNPSTKTATFTTT
jgi:hypothetical protein